MSTETLTMVQALNRALADAMAADDRVLIMGEDVGPLGGVFRVTAGLQDRFGATRVIDTPLAESGIIGVASGLAMRDYRPVCEIQFDGFIFPAYDQIVSQVARLHFRSHGRLHQPLVIRVPYGGGIGAVEHHAESPEGLFAGIPGLKVMTCSTPHDAYHLLREAIESPDPVLFFEPKRLYHVRGEVDLDAPGIGRETARIARAGTEATILAYGPMVPVALAAAEASGRDVEVIDLRSLAPLDRGTIIASVQRTGRALITHEAQRTLGLGAELAALIQEHCFYHLLAPVLRVTAYDLQYPPSKAEHDFLPDIDRILVGLDDLFAH